MAAIQERLSMFRRSIWLFLAVLTLSCFILAQDAADVTVALGEAEGVGKLLTDGQGASLYYFMNDAEGVSSCADQCAETWPPLLVEGEPTAGQGVAPTLLGTIERADGATQVTYNGLPLYYFAEDQNSGDINGQGVGDSWFLVSPYGEAIQPAEEASEETPSDEVREEADPMAMGVLMSEGRTVYADSCAVCHGREGEGGSGVALAGYEGLADHTHVIRQIIRGSQYMPAFGDELSDREIAAVATFTSNSWGNSFGGVTEEEVSGER